ASMPVWATGLLESRNSCEAVSSDMPGHKHNIASNGAPDVSICQLEHMELPAPGGRPLDLVARHKGEGLRLDQYLVSVFPGYSRTVFQKAIDAGAVTVNGARAKA